MKHAGTLVTLAAVAVAATIAAACGADPDSSPGGGDAAGAGAGTGATGATSGTGAAPAATGGAAGSGTGGSPTDPREDGNAYSDPAADVTPVAPPDFGPNVHVFDPDMPMSSIQAVLDRIFDEQETAQMGTGRHALLFHPGQYDLDVNVAYYMDVRGLGLLPGDVVITGHVHAEADWFGGNATHNFWRSVANMTVVPDGGTERWAVSQAAPFRRMHVRGNLLLDDGGWSSGGFIADSVIDGRVNSGSQQQWFTRNSNLGGWSGGVWNMTFLGVNGAPSADAWPPHTVIDQNPLIREKPFLFVNAVGNYYVFVPDVREATVGPSWIDGTQPGRSLAIDQFHVARDEVDDAASINAALESGKHLLLTPGIYRLDAPIEVKRPGTVVLAMGLPSLLPETGQPVMEIADVSGVKVAGFTIDAGPIDSPTLLRVGPAGSAADHSAYPTSLHDVFCRIGGGFPGRASGCVEINSHDVIGDHFWLWRADHGNGVGWDQNRSKNGLVVNGDDVLIEGLFVEHFHEYQTIWNGNGGRTYFYQSEMPYDIPSQQEWQHDGVNGWAAYKVGDHVTTHEAWALGAYSVYHAAPVTNERAFEVPVNDGVTMTHMIVMSIGRQSGGRVEHVINDVGGPVTNASNRHEVEYYPQ